jgi:hypothetical protein
MHVQVLPHPRPPATAKSTVQTGTPPPSTALSAASSALPLFVSRRSGMPPSPPTQLILDLALIHGWTAREIAAHLGGRWSWSAIRQVRGRANHRSLDRAVGRAEEGWS